MRRRGRDAPSIMTPSLYYKLQIFKRAIDAFNARCSCEKVTVTIAFNQQLSTDDNDFADIACKTWVGTFKSNVFEDDIIFGTVETVSDYFEKLFMKISSELIEAMAANIDEWYAGKPEIKSEILSLYKQTQSFAVLQSENIHPSVEVLNG
jgi:hypothetical protein